MPRLRLRPGMRVSDRSDSTVQVGLHPGRHVVLPDTGDVRALLSVLAHGIDADRVSIDQRDPLNRLRDAGLLVDPDDGLLRSRVRDRTRVRVSADPALTPHIVRLLGEVGLPDSPGRSGSVALIVTTGAEPRRESIDRLVQSDTPHLLVTAVAGRVRVGPCVVPGLTACLRCVDAHLTDRDPRHPLVVEQHLDVDLEDEAPAADLSLALAWAVRDLVALIEGDRPTTWSATVDLESGPPVIQAWRRHPRCGCAWGDALVG